jgi:hypothetical protein
VAVFRVPKAADFLPDSLFLFFYVVATGGLCVRHAGRCCRDGLIMIAPNRHRAYLILQTSCLILCVWLLENQAALRKR